MAAKKLLEALKDGSLDRDTVKGAARRAIVEFADWLAHPTELGEYPDEIEVLDARSLAWPPEGKALPMQLLRYRVRDKSGFEPDNVGVGLVGTTTFSLFGYENHLRPVEDCYAMHCYWECKEAGLIVESERIKPKQLTTALKAAPLDIDDPSPMMIVRFAESPPKRRKSLGYPGDEVVFVAGEHEGVRGWLVCDGPRTTWYPASEMPNDAPAETVVMVHVGRVLLGFDVRDVERSKHLGATFLLDDKPFLQRYEAALTAARKLAGAKRKKAFDSFGPLARHASRYVKLLAAKGRTKETKAFIEELVPYWNHNTGYSELGKLAFDAKLFEVSKQFIDKLRESYPDHHRSETMGLLARIYVTEGKKKEGIALLRKCISRIKADEACSPQEVALFSEPLLDTLRDLQA